MTNQEGRFTSGKTAAALSNWTTLIARVGLVSIGLGIAWSIFAPIIFRTTRVLPFTLCFVGVFFAAMLAHYLVGRAQKRVQQSELEAGYTTMADQFPQVDAIDARTGTVIRRAEAASGERPFSGTITSGSEFGVIDGLRGPLAIMLRMPFAVGGTVLSAAVAALSFAAIGENGRLAVLVILGALFGTLGLILVPTLTLGIVPSRVYLAKLKQQFPTARVYVGGFDDATGVADLVDSPTDHVSGARPRLTDYLVFKDNHLVIFSRSRSQLLPILAIPRGRIEHAEASTVPQDRGPDRPALALLISTKDGHVAAMKLPFSGSPGLYSVYKLADAVNWAVRWAKGSG